MFWTHLYDLLVKITALMFFIFVLIEVPYVGDNGVFVIVASLGFSLISYLVLLRTLGSYLYCKLSLGMNIDFSQAKKLNEALAPYPFRGLEWLPLEEVKDMEEGERYDQAIALLQEWQQEKEDQRKEQIERAKKNPIATKVLEVVSVVLVIASFAVSFLNLPPAPFFAKYYCLFFDTPSSSPFFIGCVLTLICLYPIKIIKKNLEKEID